MGATHGLSKKQKIRQLAFSHGLHPWLFTFNHFVVS